jgi:hypothetical protein
MRRCKLTGRMAKAVEVEEDRRILVVYPLGRLSCRTVRLSLAGRHGLFLNPALPLKRLRRRLSR